MFADRKAARLQPAFVRPTRQREMDTRACPARTSGRFSRRHRVSRCEGGLLKDRLRWSIGDEMRRKMDLECNGPACLDAGEILHLVRDDDLPALNGVRAQPMGVSAMDEHVLPSDRPIISEPKFDRHWTAALRFAVNCTTHCLSAWQRSSRAASRRTRAARISAISPFRGVGRLYPSTQKRYCVLSCRTCGQAQHRVARSPGHVDFESA